jgi:hypothetical protein
MKARDSYHRLPREAYLFDSAGVADRSRQIVHLERDRDFASSILTRLSVTQ